MRHFYPSLQTKKRDPHKKSSHLATSAAVPRRTQELSCPFNLLKSPEFPESHHVLNATLKKKNAEGVLLKTAVSQDDLNYLERYVDGALKVTDSIKLTQFTRYS